MKSRIGDPNLATAEPRRPKPRPLLSWLSFGAVVSLVGIIGFKFPETALAGVAAPFLTVTVQVDNYSQASPAVLAAAEQEAGRILGEAGLRAVWLECPMVPSTAEPQGPCKKAPEATEIRLRILPAPVQNKVQDTVFGFTVHPVLASVYYGSAVRLAKSEDAEFEAPIILGCVIAHEIGHLLLGPNSHSVAGIMQRQWERKQVDQAMTGTLLFMPEQSKLMRAQAQTRIGLQKP